MVHVVVSRFESLEKHPSVEEAVCIEKKEGISKDFLVFFKQNFLQPFSREGKGREKRRGDTRAGRDG